MKELKLSKDRMLNILEKLKDENEVQIVIHEVNIEMGVDKLKKATKEDEKIKEEDKKEDFGTKAVSIKMRLDDFKLKCEDLYDGLDFINKKIDEVSKGTKD